MEWQERTRGRGGEERNGELIHIKDTFYNVGNNEMYINENIYYSFLYLDPQKLGHISIRYEYIRQYSVCKKNHNVVPMYFLNTCTNVFKTYLYSEITSSF